MADVPVVQVLQFSSADVEETVELTQLRPVELRTGCCMPVVCNNRCRVVRSAKTSFVPQLQHSGTVSGIFLGPVHRWRAGGRVHRDTVTITRCTVRSYRQMSATTHV